MAASHTLTARAGRVLVVDDEPSNRRFIRQVLEREGHEVLEAPDGEAALEIAREAPPDVVLLDVMMPGADGFATCAAIKRRPETRLTPVVLVTALAKREHRLQGIEAGADDFLTKPFDVHEMAARVRSLVRLKRYIDEMDSAEAVLMSLAMTIEARDAVTEGHCERLATYAAALGRALGLPEDDLGALHRGGYLHDIGKVGVPDAVLLKPGRLTDTEFEVMKSHTTIGDRLCSPLRSLAKVRDIVRHHHEKLDGSGYPDGLRGSEIPLLAQIIGVVDVFDALTTARPYKPELSAESACAELYREADLGWRDRELVDVFVRLVREDAIEFRPRRDPARVFPPAPEA